MGKWAKPWWRRLLPGAVLACAVLLSAAPWAAAQTQPAETEGEELWADNVLMEDDIGFCGSRENTTKDFAANNSRLMAATVLGSDILRRQVAGIAVLDTLTNCPEDAWDVSQKKNGTVMAWVEETAPAWDMSDPDAAGLKDKPAYHLFIAGEGGVCAPKNCTGLFGGYVFAKEIRFDGHFYTDFAEDMSHMFRLCFAAERLDVADLQTGRVKSMAYMFSQTQADLDLSGFDTALVTDMEGMFQSTAGRLAGMEGWNTSNVRNMVGMFAFAAMEKLDLSAWDVSRVEDMYRMFMYNDSLISLNLAGWNAGKVTDMGQMFMHCGKLIHLDLSGMVTSSVKKMSSMFDDCELLGYLDLSGFDTSQITDMSWLFLGCQNLYALDLSGFDTSRVTTMTMMFSGCKSLHTLDLSRFNTAKVTNMSFMFAECEELAELDISSFNTAKVMDMRSMFTFCRSLPPMDFSNFVIHPKANVGRMFFRSSLEQGEETEEEGYEATEALQ